jgi:hypothetical protein
MAVVCVCVCGPTVWCKASSAVHCCAGVVYSVHQYNINASHFLKKILWRAGKCKHGWREK